MLALCLLKDSADLIPEPIQVFSFQAAVREARWSRTLPARNVALVADDLLQTAAGSESQRPELASNQIQIMREKDGAMQLCLFLNMQDAKYS